MLAMLVGPPAVGKMTVGLALAARTGLRLFHNHHTMLRLAEKPFERDLAASRDRLLADDARYRLGSRGEFDHGDDWFRIETTVLEAGEVAERIVERFGLPRARQCPRAT